MVSDNRVKRGEEETWIVVIPVLYEKIPTCFKMVLKKRYRERTYYSLLEDMGDLKGNYADYMTTKPINCSEELQRVANADYELCTALLTAILREDHFSNGSFEHRQRAGQVDEILKRMVAELNK